MCLRLVTTKNASSESGGEELRDLLQRGLQTPVTITTDGAAGLRKAVDRLGPRARRLRCGLPKRPTLLQQVPPPAGPACTALGAALRDAPRCEEGQRRFQTLRAQSQGTLPAACRGLEDDAEARLNHCKVPRRHRQYVRPSTRAERACEEERRCPQVMPHLWDDARGVQRVCAVLRRVSECWGQKPYRELEQHPMRALRHPGALEQQSEGPALVTMAPQPRRSAASAR